ncbi:MAG: TetR/AcrR family transcriptional regulator [Saprospiraceae bacterium]
MGITDRKEREKQELTELILKEARAVFLEEGFEKTSIRKIADRIEYSPTTIYLYFKDKNELLLGLHQEAFTHLFAALSSVGSVPDAFDRLVALGRSYIEYGLKNPEEYDLMFMLSAPMDALDCRHEVWCDGERAIDLVKSMVDDCKAHQYFPPEINTHSMAIMLWSTVHGLVSLHLKNRFAMFKDQMDIEKMIHDSFTLYVEFLKKFKS